MDNHSTQSSTDETVGSHSNDAIDPKVNKDLHGQESDEEKHQKLELGEPENQEWSASFGEGEMENLKIGGGVDPVFEAKAAVVNRALQHIGMGKYQWKLFALCGFGWVLLIIPRDRSDG